MVFTNQVKSSTSITNIPISGILTTWNSDNDTWAASVGIWDNPGAIIFTNTSKSSTVVTNQPRNT